MQNAIEQATHLGIQSFNSGESLVPFRNNSLMDLLETQRNRSWDCTPILTAYQNGFITAQQSAPVPEELLVA